MSLDKSIKSGKEHRKPYRGSKAFDPHCRDARCPYCYNNKFHNLNKKVLSMDELETDYKDKDGN